MPATAPGREPVQIVEVRQPLCANVFGTAPCTATGGGDAKCYNTRATCLDPDNYRQRPEGHLAADRTYDQGDTLQDLDFARTSDFLFGMDVIVPASPSGVLWELGFTTTAAYLGFDGAGNIVFRAGDGASGSPANAAKLSVAATPILSSFVTLIGEIDVSANSVSLWAWDPRLRTVTSLGTATASGSFSTWAGLSDGGVGTVIGTTAAGEVTTDTNCTIRDFRVYDSTAAPDMTGDFVLPLRFSRGHVADRGVSGAPYVIPSLYSISTAPNRLNLSRSSPDAGGLGTRALVTASFRDHPHTDRVVDPYLSGRSWDPMTLGSFWSKWLRRNLYRQNVLIRVFEGYAGEALSAMSERRYFLQEVYGPDDNGRVSITAKDVLTAVEERKAQVPTASPGELAADISDAVTSFAVQNALVTEYSPTGAIRIGDEIMTYSAVVATGSNIRFTVSARGTDGTTADAHDANSAVQECRRYTSQRIDDVIEDLLSACACIDPGWLALDDWQSEVDDYLISYKLTTLITEPTAVATLLNEIQEQTQCYLWWDERSASVKLRAIRGVEAEAPLISAESHIMPGMRVEERPRERASQVWIYYGLRNPADALDEATNYDNLTVIADLESETDDQYGEPSLRKIFSRWLRAGALADTSATKVINRYSVTPRVARWRMDAKDRTYWTGDVVRISHPLLIDAFGQREIGRWTITEAREVVPGEVVEYVAEDTTVYSIIYFVLPSGSGDYPGVGLTDFGDAYIGDADGLLSDGEPCAQIS